MGYTIKPTSGTQKAATRKGGDGRVRTESITESILPGSMKKRKTYTRVEIKENAQLWLLMLPTIALILVFSYIPMYGILIAFQKYLPGKDIIGPNAARWVGLANFRKFVSSVYFPRILRNTVILSLYSLAFGFLAPILFALLLDQIRALRFKKFLQTVSYMPHFISTVVVVGMVCSFIYTDGLITQFLTIFGLPAKNYRMDSGAFRIIYTATKVWQGFGWGSILYVATISGISPQLYEAAKLDGANRWQQVWHITLTGLRPIIAINLIMSIGGILSSDSSFIQLLYQPATYEVSDVLGTYIYRLGIEEGQYSLTTAAGLFMSLIGFALTFTANKLSDWLTGYALW